MRPLGKCKDCGKRLVMSDAYPGAHNKARHLVPLRMRRLWCRGCWLVEARRLHGFR